MVINNYLYEHMKSIPDKLAFIHGKMRLTYKQLYEAVCQWQIILINMNIKENDCVTLLLPNGLDFISCFPALFAIKAIAHPLSIHLSPDIMRQLINETRPVLIITDDSLISSCYPNIKSEFPDIPIMTTGQHELADYRMLDKVCYYKSNHEPLNDRRGIYMVTSGSEGQPKLITRYHRHLFHEVFNFTKAANITSQDSFFCLVPFYHSYGFENAVLAALYKGCTLIIPDDPLSSMSQPSSNIVKHWIDLIMRYKIQIILGVPIQYLAFCDFSDHSVNALTCVRYCFSSGSYLNQSVFDTFNERYGLPIRSLYGSTEAGTVCVNLTGDVQWHHLGPPLPHVTIQIMTTHGQHVSIGEMGSIWIKSPVLPEKGYYNDKKNRSKRFKNGFFISGDYGRIDLSGNVYIEGRKDRLIQSGDHQINPQEIEHVLIMHPRVKETVVLGIEICDLREIIVAAVVLTEACTTLDIKYFCQEKLALYQIPEWIEFIHELPKNELGKINIQILKNHLLNGKIETSLTKLSSNKKYLNQISNLTVQEQYMIIREHIIIRISWLTKETKKMLETWDAPGLMDSITTLRLVHYLSLDFSCHLPITFVWDYPTISQMTTAISKEINMTIG